MRYLVINGDGQFAADCEGTRFAAEYPDAHLFDHARDAYLVAKALARGAYAVSEKAYAEDCALSAEK